MYYPVFRTLAKLSSTNTNVCWKQQWLFNYSINVNHCWKIPRIALQIMKSYAIEKNVISCRSNYHARKVAALMKSKVRCYIYEAFCKVRSIKVKEIFRETPPRFRWHSRLTQTCRFKNKLHGARDGYLQPQMDCPSYKWV